MAAGADPDTSRATCCDAAPRATRRQRAAGDAAIEAAHHGAPHTRRGLPRARAAGARPRRRSRPLLSQLATVAYDAGLPDARERLREALGGARSRRPARRAHAARGAERRRHRRARPVAAVRGRARHRGRSADAAGDRGRRAGHADHRSRPPRGARAARGGDRPRRVADPVLRERPAHRAWLATERGVPDATACAALAREALAGDELLHDAGRRAAYHLASRALVMTDHADEAGARSPGCASMRWSAARCACTPPPRGTRPTSRCAAGASTRPRTRRGWPCSPRRRRQRAHRRRRRCPRLRAGRARRLRGGARAAARARARRRDGRRAVGERACSTPARGWRWPRATSSARCRGARERRPARGARAPEPDLDGVALDGRAGPRSPRAPGGGDRPRRRRARAGRGLRRPGSDRRRPARPCGRRARCRRAGGACERALEAVAPAPGLLESIRARLELGSALAYLGRRTEAREALRPALADADAVGAVLLAQRARRELVATGLRPRQAALEGAAALTPRQRQVCELAAAGKGNRQIAQALFLSIKTVETHLAAGYRKLGVGTRPSSPPGSRNRSARLERERGDDPARLGRGLVLSRVRPVEQVAAMDERGRSAAVEVDRVARPQRRPSRPRARASRAPRRRASGARRMRRPPARRRRARRRRAGGAPA